MFSIFSARFGSRAALLVILLAAIAPSLALADLSEEKKLTVTGGAAVAISDDGYVAVVGDITGNGGAGAVYVYTRTLDTTTWTPAATLTDVSGQAGDQFGASVSISGDAPAPTSPSVHPARVPAPVAFMSSPAPVQSGPRIPGTSRRR